MNGVEKGFEKVLLKQSFNTETTKEEMIAYIKGFADKVCSLLDLHIIEELTREHEYGAFYYLGIIGSQHPIICIGNPSSVTYCKVYIAVTYVTPEGLPSCSLSFTSSSNIVGIKMTINSEYYLKYMKMNDITAFGFVTGTITMDNGINMNFFISKLINGTLGTNTLFVKGSTELYYSYVSELGEKIRTRTPQKSTLEALTPLNKDLICDLFINNFMISKVKAFTNKTNMTAGTIFAINEKKYSVIHYDSYITFICELPPDEQTQ